MIIRRGNRLNGRVYPFPKMMAFVEMLDPKYDQ